MNFDNDDPLGSDDSFFEEPKALNRKSSLTKKADKKSIENLFNITDTKTSEESVKNDAEGIKKTKSTVTFEEPLSSEFTSDPLKKIQKKNEDWLGISDHTNAPDKQVKKTDFLDDILSGHPSSSRNKKVISFDDILKDSKLNTNKSSDQLKENPAPTETTSNFSLLSSTSKEKRRGRRGSSTPVEDALGLFGDEFQSGDFYTKDKKKPTTSDFQIKSNIASERVVPDWLGGSSITSVKADTDSAKETEIPDKNDFEHEMKQSVPEEEENKKTKPSTGKPETNDVPITAKQQQINKELQSTYASLQQQESLLLISLQLKKYESNLDEVKRQQQEIMEKQEQHFKSLVDQHIMKQQIIDNNVRLQQERINSHIQTLLAHPSSNTSLNDSEKENTHNRDGFLKDFEKTVDTLKQRHHEELFIMEESYKKQIALLEKSTEMLEEKLNNEITTLSKHFEEKINTINRNCNEEISYYKQKIITIEEQHNSEIKLIKENHIQAVEEMKRDHVTQIQYLKEFKQQEKDLLKDGLIYAQKLDSSIEILNSNTKALEVVQDKLINNYDIISTARENSIESKEKEIILMRNALEKCREAAENERSQLFTLIRSLEVKIAEQNNNAREERWALQQASATLVARSAALDRESEYNRTTIEREREQLKTLKESLLAEQEKMILQLTEEKLQLSAEKARIETSKQLTNNYESERIKTEAETAIQVTKELTLKLNQERNQLIRQKNEIEMLKRSLDDREALLENRETELEYLTQNAQRKINEEKKIINDAKKLEMQYKDRLQELQNQWMSLSVREKKLAEEKVLLSKERLTLYTTMKQAKGCVLCKANENDTFHDDFLQNRVSDPDAIRFRFETIEDERNSEVSKEENNFGVPEVSS